MHIQSFTFNPFQTNCYICHDDSEAAIIDPSCSTDEEMRQVERFVDEEKLTVRHLLLTHGHIDHIFGCARLSDRYGLPWRMHRSDVDLLKEAPQQAQLFGVSIDPPPIPEAFLEAGDSIEIGSATMRVLHTPGHSPGSISFFAEAQQLVLSGDVLFKGFIGRTDLWQGSLPTLMRSIFQELIALGDDVQVYPGHGPRTTTGFERRSNPFLTGSVPSGG